MIEIKPGAKIKGIQPEISLGLRIIEGIMTRSGYKTVLTEGTGSQHMVGSKHYIGQAVDIRSKDILSTATKYTILSECIHALGNDFNMLLENLEQENEHFHAEWDPEENSI